MGGSHLEGRTVLVTGAAGFIGFHLANRLLAAGACVVGIDCVNAYYDVAIKEARLRELARWPAFRFKRCNITEHKAVRSIFESCKPEFVAHLAAQAGVRHSLTNPRAYVSSNVDGFLAIFEACRAQTVRHLLYASSSSVYGADSKVPFQETDPAVTPVSLYAATKRADELMAEAYAHLFGVPGGDFDFSPCTDLGPSRHGQLHVHESRLRRASDRRVQQRADATRLHLYRDRGGLPAS